MSDRDSCISESGKDDEVGAGRGRPRDSGPPEAAAKRGSPRPQTRSKAPTVDGAARARARIKQQGGAKTPTMRRAAMAGVNAAIEVGKHQLELVLGSAGEWVEPHEPRAIKR